jgi:2-keto-4-pentenoate hydratase/2-oxohepta-3-ene-1,7-dioic acid hydratase in catechol pathway
MLLCVGLNYRRHAHETGNAIPRYPIVFAKNVAAVQRPGGAVVLPPVTEDPPEVDYEAELAFVIGRACKDVRPEHALAYVAGYMCANDISARRWQGKRGGGQWYTGKSFDTFCPLGPELVAPDAVGDPQQLRIALDLNGRRMQVPRPRPRVPSPTPCTCSTSPTRARAQSSTTADMIYDVRSLVSFLSQGTTLLPGTVVLTGTPEGVGYTRTPPVFLRPGDRMRVSIERLGVLDSTVEASTPDVRPVWTPAHGEGDDAAPPRLQTGPPTSRG